MLKRWMIVLAWTASILAFWAVLDIRPLSLTGLAGLSVLGSLALLAAIWIGRKTSRPMAQLIDDIDAEPRFAAAVSRRVNFPMHKGVIRLKGEGPR